MRHCVARIGPLSWIMRVKEHVRTSQSDASVDHFAKLSREQGGTNLEDKIGLDTFCNSGMLEEVLAVWNNCGTDVS